ncbi:MAG: fibronectin type III domain-containing protein [Firmicutes bacterium]|nr:fibronectin type III domain-containing protein [Bacillota bacterium]MBR3706918.1 fibronectin type III domain-containing protein [Bacillota bacterium]
MKRWLLSLCVALVLMLTATSAFADTVKVPLSTTEIEIEPGRVYTISNAEELFNFAALVNEKGYTFKGAAVELLSDIVVISGKLDFKETYNDKLPILNGMEIPEDGSVPIWEPIGSYNYIMSEPLFCGIFEGNNHSISGLYNGNESSAGLALFGRCSGAMIQNVEVENFLFKGARCAGICGTAKNGTIIQNCSSRGIILSRGTSGGIVGAIMNDDDYIGQNSEIRSCKSSCVIVQGVKSTDTFFENSNSGGIAGYCKDANVINCVSGSYVKGTDGIGHIIGYAEKNVEYTGSTGNGTAIGKDYNGRLVGNKIETGIHEHSYKLGNVYDDTHHYVTCVYCGEELKRMVHSFDPAKETVITDKNSTHYGKKIRVCSLCDAHIMTKDVFTGIVTIDIDYSKCKVVYIDRDTVTFRAEPGYVISEVLVNTIPVSADAQIDLRDWDDIKVTVREKMPVSNETLIKGVQNTTLKVKTVLVGDRQIRVIWTKSKGYKMDYYEIYRSSKKSKTTSGKPFYTTKTGNTKSYCSARNLKKGTKYYYKVRGVRVIDGKKYYTKWSNYGIRTFRG